MPNADADMALLEAARQRWMSGGNASTGADPFLEENTDAEIQLRLLALAAQFKPVCLRPRAPENLVTQSPFPSPGLPLLPEPLRPLFRRLAKQADTRQKSEGLITLMARRGFMAHPFDWLPPTDPTGYPDAYIPVSKWIAGAVQHEETTLSIESWDDLFPAERRLAVEVLRRADPAAARALLEAKAATSPAEERLRLIDLLAINLSIDDQSYLEGLHSADRSGKVKERARQLLARIGAFGTTEGAKELAAFFEVGKAGILRRKITVRVRRKLNPAQQRRAHELLMSVPVAALAAAFELTVDEFIGAIDFSDEDWNEAFLTALAETGTRDDLIGYWHRLKDGGQARFVHLETIRNRLSREVILDEAQALVESGSFALDACLSVVGPDAPPAFSDALLKAKAVRGPIAQVIKDQQGNSGGQSSYTMQQTLRIAFSGLGLILSRDAAERMLGEMTASGIHIADPLLDPLKFNTALKGASS